MYLNTVSKEERPYSGAYAAVETRHGLLTVFANDCGAVTKSLMRYGEWAENEISFLRQFLSPDSIVLDVGAYIGTHSLAFASAVGSSGRVLAIEAQPETFAVLAKNTAGHSEIELYNAIASSESTAVRIPLIDIERESSFGSTSLRETLGQSKEDLIEGLPMDQRATIAAITIDSFELHQCQLIKVDVEGLEDVVLRGAVQTVRRCSPVVYCECNTIAAGLRTLGELESAGYRVFAHVVNAFNANNFLGIEENIFGDAREVALLGVPSCRAEEVRRLPLSGSELLLDIRDADDLALALLNKPQYQPEVLRFCHAAPAGGTAFLDEYERYKLEVSRLENLAETVQKLRMDESKHFQQWIQTIERERATLAEIAETRLTHLAERDTALSHCEAQLIGQSAVIEKLHDELQQRDTGIAELQAELQGRAREIAGLHYELQQRDAGIAELQAELQGRAQEIAGLHHELQQRDAGIAGLQAELQGRAQEIAGLHHELQQRDAGILHLQIEIKEQAAQLVDLGAVMKKFEADVGSLVAERALQEADLARMSRLISELYASNSWQATRPLRWVENKIRRFRSS